MSRAHSRGTTAYEACGFARQGRRPSRTIIREAWHDPRVHVSFFLESYRLLPTQRNIL